MSNAYVHGYSKRENQRLEDQATTLTELLHADTLFPEGDHVLEAGCGIGSQTITVARKNPKTLFTSIDLSEVSLEQARLKIESAHLSNVQFQHADIFHLPFEPETFDHVFVCFVLEHLRDPVTSLLCLKKVMKPGGTVTVIEGDHGSVYFYPESEEARQAIRCQIELQAQAGGNALIGRELYPLLSQAGFIDIRVSPRTVYVDSSRPELVDGFTRKTFTAMIEGVKKQALEQKLITEAIFDKGIRDMYRTTESDGTFCYTFFKAFAAKSD